MRKKIHYMFYISIIILVEFSIYIALGLYKKSVGCRGIAVDCYIPEAAFAKEMQVIVVILALLTLIWFLLAVVISVWKYFPKYMKKVMPECCRFKCK